MCPTPHPSPQAELLPDRDPDGDGTKISVSVNETGALGPGAPVSEFRFSKVFILTVPNRGNLHTQDESPLALSYLTSLGTNTLKHI